LASAKERSWFRCQRREIPGRFSRSASYWHERRYNSDCSKLAFQICRSQKTHQHFKSPNFGSGSAHVSCAGRAVPVRRTFSRHLRATNLNLRKIRDGDDTVARTPHRVQYLEVTHRVALTLSEG
jgi:hypothetical protein